MCNGWSLPRVTLPQATLPDGDCCVRKGRHRWQKKESPKEHDYDRREDGIQFTGVTTASRLVPFAKEEFPIVSHEKRG